MVRGLYTAASGALVAQSMSENVANNLANVNTSGFKETLLQIQSAPVLDIYRVQNDPGKVPGAPLAGVPVAPYVGALGTGAWVYDTPQRFSQGPLQSTGNPLDLAISGTNGFFAVQTAQGVRYTRDGQFAQSANGTLVTQDGNPVLDVNGNALVIPQATQSQGKPSVGVDGTVSQGGITIGKLALVGFGNLTALRNQGDNLMVDSGNAGPTAATNVGVQQGFLEKSNGNVVRSMVDLITAERWFDMNERAIKCEDDATNQAIASVAHPTATG